LIHPSHIFLATPFLSFSSLFLFQSLSFILSYTYIFLYFSIYLSFFSIHIFFSLFFPLLTSLSLFSSSQLLSFLHKHNLKFKIKHARDETKLWE
jgi:hypothetical protein